MNIPKSLIEKIAQDKVVLFIGAGLSMGAGFPSWEQLILDILDSISDREVKSKKFKEALNNGILEPLEVLNKIERHREFAIEALEKNIRIHDDKKPTTVHAKLENLSTKIITTNYDCLLEKQLPKYEMITYSNNYKISKLSDYKKYIFKIHGNIHEPDKCILFPSQYKKLYSKSEQSSVFELKKIISEKSILFIGFSLSDPHINYIFDYISNIYDGFTPEHFIITTDENNTWPNRITPIQIESHENLGNAIDEIIKQKNDFEIEKFVPLATVLEKNKGNISVSANLEYDLPPQNKFWVGRTKELNNISSDIFKVVFITGIGGQGKSALAAYYLKNYFDSGLYEFADWRDFKEESNRFQTKLISIIKRITNDSFALKNLEEVTNSELVDVFFDHLGSRRIIFVLDNIDSYIDLEAFIPTGGIKYFFEKALTLNHNSKFIFTCRPFIREASVNFYQLQLSGLSEKDCDELFEFYKIPINNKQRSQLSKKAFNLTNGHPLWLNLIAAQALRGVNTVNEFIDNIQDKTDFNENDFSSILSEKILNEVWNSLNEKQKILLRGIAETVKPETTNDLRKVIQTELNSNQYNRALKVLQNLNLIEIKSSYISEDQVELHPLVKEFILSKFLHTERVKFITYLVNYYDEFIYILKPKLSSDMSLSSFQNWTSKIELQINQNDFQSALISLQEVSSSLLAAGFSEEYLRVSEKLFHSINWQKAIEAEYSYFETQLSTLSSILTQFGKFTESEEFLLKYSKLISGKNSQYLTYSSQMCYLRWYQKKYDEAIEVGEYGVFLLDESGISDSVSLRHNLALARRDSNNSDNISKALTYFLKNEDIETITSNIKSELGGHFYGNIGKCLELLNKPDEALKCYFISLSILFSDDDSYSKLNIGYAASWIFNTLKGTDRKLDALYFLKLSINTWQKSSPIHAKKMKKEWEILQVDKQTKDQVDNMLEWKIIQLCKKIVESEIVVIN